MGLLSWIKGLSDSSPSKIETRLAELKRDAFRLDIQAARDQALRFVRAQGAVQREPPTSQDAAFIAQLPAAPREILTEYAAIEIGELTISRESFASMTLGDEPLAVIGTDIEHASLVTSEQGEQVWLLEPHHIRDKVRPEPYPSLWHYLLVVEATSKPNWWAEP